MNIFKIKFMLSALVLVGLFHFDLALAQADTKRCSPNAAQALDEAMIFLKENGHALKHDFKIGDRKATRRRIRRRFDRKVDEMRFSCATKVLCREKAPRIALHAFGIAGRKIRICYDKMITRNFRFCDLVEFTSHEFGHAIGIKKDRLGRHHKKQNDRVYQFGWFAKALCESTVIDNYVLMP